MSALKQLWNRLIAWHYPWACFIDFLISCPSYLSGITIPYFPAYLLHKLLSYPRYHAAAFLAQICSISKLSIDFIYYDSEVREQLDLSEYMLSLKSLSSLTQPFLSQSQEASSLRFISSQTSIQSF